MQTIRILYLANTGFFITAQKHRILLDAVFTRRHYPFSAMPKNVLEKILTRTGHFSDVTMLIVTHRHEDHCDGDALLRYSGDGTPVILPLDVYEAGMPETKLRLMPNPVHGGKVFEDDTLRVTAIPTRHDGPQDVLPGEHFSYLLEFLPEHVNLLALGDAETTYEQFSPYLDGKRIDLMTANFVEINQDRGRTFLNRIHPILTLLCHLPLPEDDQYRMAKLAGRNLDRLKDALPDCLLCDMPGIAAEVTAEGYKVISIQDDGGTGE